MGPFKDRREAGLLLADKLVKYKGLGTIVLGIPRGGLPVADEIAKKLDTDMDIVLSKKIGHPNNPEFAIGALTLNTITIDPSENIPKKYLDERIKELRVILSEKNRLYRGGKKQLNLKSKIVIIVDDGIATGNTLLTTIEMLRKEGVKKIVVASPVVPADRVEKIESASDEFIYLLSAEYFPGVAYFYEEFEQVDDSRVIEILSQYPLNHKI